MSQHDLILVYLRKYKGITSMEAFNRLGITQLATRIKELKERGYQFGEVWEENDNRFGVPCRYKRYFLVGRRKDYDENDLLEMDKDIFLASFDVAEEEYEMLQKDMQEM